MPRYTVQFTSHALRALRRLERRDQLRVAGAVELLAENPRPPACTALVGMDGVYRVRAGDHRIVYEVRDSALLVLVIRVGHRREVYRP